MPDAMHGEVKTYYLVFGANAPAGITESWKAAEYWQRQGCTIETYHRNIRPTEEKEECEPSS